MPINVIAHDTRLEGVTPNSTSSTITFEVDGDTPIQQFFDRVIQISDEHSGIRTLFIMAHGVHVLDVNTTAILFTHDFISYLNIHLFEQFQDKLEKIVLFVCHASETDMTEHGDGDELCRQMAVNAQVELTAAREVQIFGSQEHCTFGLFCEETEIEFGEWEGTVVVYDRNGRIIAEFHNPSAWHDSDGILHDPRIDTDPRARDEARRERSRERFSRHSLTSR
jgi:glutathione peroxidase-family protein